MGDSASNVLDGSHIETWSRGWLIQLDHTSLLHWTLDGQLELLKGVEEYQVVQQVIRAYLEESILRQLSTDWA